MDTSELIDASTSLRWTLRIWNGLCLLAAALCIAAGFVLAIGSSGDSVGDAVAGSLAVLAFGVVLIVATIWLLVRLVLLTGWRFFDGN